jgi:hypothetical protein
MQILDSWLKENRVHILNTELKGENPKDIMNLVKKKKTPRQNKFG